MRVRDVEAPDKEWPTRDELSPQKCGLTRQSCLACVRYPILGRPLKCSPLGREALAAQELVQFGEHGFGQDLNGAGCLESEFPNTECHPLDRTRERRAN